MPEELTRIIELVTDIVKSSCADHDWKYHVCMVVKNAKILAEQLGQDVKIAELAALLHDIGGYRFGWDSHEVTGEKEAEKILKSIKCKAEVINEIKHCVICHRNRPPNIPSTVLGKIICDADALSHFDAVPWLLFIGLYRNTNNIEAARNWVLTKLERNFANKIMLEVSLAIAKPKLAAARIILSE